MESQAIDQASEENEARGAELLNQDGNNFITPLTEEQMQGFSASQKAEARTDNLANGIERMNDYAGNLKAEMGEWDQKAGAIEKHIASLDQESVALRSEKAKLDAKPREQRSHEDMEQFRNVNAEIERVDTEKAAARQQKAEIQANKSKLSNEYNRVTKASGEAGKVLSDMKSYNRSKNIGRESEILDRMANIQNFDTPAFRNISAERRAELYEQRNDALQKVGRLEHTGNLVGGTIGGVTGGAFGIMAGPVAEDFAKTGADLGRGIGNMAVKPYMDHLTARASREYEKNRVSYDGYESLFPDQKGVPINRSAYSVPVDYTTLPELFTPEKAKIGKDAYQWGNAYDEKEYYGRNAARVWDDSVTDPKRKEIMRDLLKNTYTSDLLKDAKETFRDSFYDEDMKITGLSRSEVIRKQKENFLNRQASICGNSLYDTLKHHGYLPEYLNGMHEGQEKMLKDAFVHEQGDFAKNLIQSYLTAMNVWPKEGEE